MKSKTGTIQRLRIRVRLHYTWYLAFILITIIVVNQFPVLYQLWERIILGLATSLIFFITISVRQFVLSAVAFRRRMPLNNFTLFVFGGACQLAVEDNHPSLEALKGMTGILLNLALAIIFYLIHMALVINGNVMIAGIIQWLAFITLLLTFFHIIPGYPLDGGKILLALLWKRTGDYYRSALVTGWIGWACGLILIMYGIYILAMTPQKYLGITLAFVGLSLERAATQGRREATLRRNVHDVYAQNIMTREYPVISRLLNVGQLVRDCILAKAQHYFIVADGAALEGIVTIYDIKNIPKRKWKSAQVGEIMTPASKVRTARMNQTGDILLEQMEKWEIRQMPVIDDNRVAGIVIRDDLVRLSRSRVRLRT